MAGKDPHHYVIRSATPDDPGDLAITRALGDEMYRSGRYPHIPRRDGGRKELDEQYKANRSNNCALLAFCDDQPVGMLIGSVSYLFSLNYILAMCMFVYVKPDARDGKSALLLLSAFRQWAESRGADELRFQVTSNENSEKSHEMFLAMGCIYIGGNYTYPVSEQGLQVYPLSEKAKAAFPRVARRKEGSDA